MRRKGQELLGIEIEILDTAFRLTVSGAEEFHGYQLTKELAAGYDYRAGIGHGTVYRALDRLEKLGMLRSWWEPPLLAEAEGRPRRRLYAVTTAGAAAREQSASAARYAPRRLRTSTADR